MLNPKHLVCWHMCQISVVLVNVALLIELKESPKCEQIRLKKVYLLANCGCSPHQQFSLALPVNDQSTAT